MISGNIKAGARLDYLDATRAFALVLGVVFHASLSFLPVFMGWAVQDVSTSAIVGGFVTISHSFRMELFFLLAGCFACVALRRKSATDFLRSRARRIVLPFVVGWFLLRPLMVSGWIMGSASLRGDWQFWTGIVAGFKTLEALPEGIFTGSHLWFLYYLAMITVLAFALRAAVAAAGSGGTRVIEAVDALTRWAANSSWGLPLAAVPTAGALWFMRYWGMDTPDRSLVPHLPVLAVYGGFFAAGWGMGRQPDTMESLSRLSFARWLGAGVGIAGVLWLEPIQGQPSHAHFAAAHAAFALSYALMMWSLVFLTIGGFRRLCVRPRAWIRYVADSSYWMYLIHLPIVVWMQVAFAELPLSWAIKLAAISIITVGLALFTYDLFVRSTWLGVGLSGGRQPRVLLRGLRPRLPTPAPHAEARV